MLVSKYALLDFSYSQNFLTYISLTISVKLNTHVYCNSQVGQEIILNNNFNIMLQYK